MKQLLIFVAGAAVGAVASYFVAKNKFEKENEADIQSLREMYDERVKKIQNASDAIKSMNAKKDEIMHDIEKQVQEEHEDASSDEKPEGYVDYNSISKKKTEKKKTTNSIRFITEAEAQKYSKDYELVGLSLYSDNVLIDDETENIIEDYEAWLGVSDISSIHSNGEESVYVLNEVRGAIYDINPIDERFGDVNEPFTIE